MTDKSQLPQTDEQWAQQLTPEQYRICRQKGTERAFTGEYYHNTANGEYHCVCCGELLFESATKYDSGSGWPSFWAPAQKGAITEHLDRSHGMMRTEITCAHCDAHLGHVFTDGPQPSGLRYCVNSASLSFEEKE